MRLGLSTCVSHHGLVIDELDVLVVEDHFVTREGLRRMLVARTGKPGSPLTELTAGELEALRLMAEGYSNVGIAERCHVAIGTVEKRIAAVFTKLGLMDRGDLNRRVQAVLLYLKESSIGR